MNASCTAFGFSDAQGKFVYDLTPRQHLQVTFMSGRSLLDQVQTNQGFFSVRTTCPHCQGAGSLIDKPCGPCRGRGRVPREREIEVDVPAGVDSGMRIRISGEGEAGENGAPRGDLFCHVEVRPHEWEIVVAAVPEDEVAFPLGQRDDARVIHAGEDVVCSLPISFTQAALGATLRVPTMGGEAELSIPTGTPSEQVFRLRRQGFPRLRGSGNGDQYVRVHIDVPRQLTPKQKEMLTAFAQTEDIRLQPKKEKSFFEKVKDIFE